MELIKITCPNCKSNIKVGDNTKSVVCDYCKTEFLVDDGVVRSETHKIITDEAKLKELELKKEILDRKREEKEKKKKKDLIGWCALGLVMLFLFTFLFIYEKGHISMPEKSSYYCERNYKVVQSELEDLGFKNIEIRTIDDLVIGLFSKEEDVESISINGIKNFDKGKEFSKDDKVVITYHIYKKK